MASRINIDLMSLSYAKAIQIRNIWDENKVLSVYALSQRYPEMQILTLFMAYR